MGFLSPLFLLAASAVAVPLILHLFHRHESRRLVFPALRYLLRTERDHARRIRTRQILLLLVRCLAVVLLVTAGARLFWRGVGGAHPPTALVIVLDNSLSSGRVLDDERVLDRLKALALTSVDQATAEDRIWVIRAGEPWEVTPPGGPAEARRRVEETEPSGAHGRLTETLRRARALALGAGLPDAEIQLLSDLQASGFERDAPAPADGVPVVVFTGIPEAESNHYLHEARAGGGLPPLAGRRTEVTVQLGGTPGDTMPVPVRLILEGTVRGAVTLRPGASGVLPVGPFPVGTVTGWVEADPDALRADDRRYLAFPVRAPPQVALVGDAGPFVREALAVLEAGGRIRLAPDPATASVLVAVGGAGLDIPGPERRVVIPSSDPILLPALNRRLADAGIPWRLGSATVGTEATVSSEGIPVFLEGVRVGERWPPESLGPDEATVLATLSDGSSWIVAGDAPSGAYLMLASPLDERASTLPVDAAMVPLLEWILSGWSVGEGDDRYVTGDPIPLPAEATAVERPDGTRVPADGTRELRATRDPGIYTVLRDDSVMARVPVNASIRESLLTPLSREALPRSVGDAVVTADAPRNWQRETFTSRQGRELWRILALGALLLLLLESWMASSGGRATSRRSEPASAADIRSAPHA